MHHYKHAFSLAFITAFFLYSQTSGAVQPDACHKDCIARFNALAKACKMLEKDEQAFCIESAGHFSDMCQAACAEKTRQKK